ncbi:uncharacterized protein LOC119649135 isoform X2 [Hermetia illucens]|nr:uncharacterized protein LOC119649135 isoform X2 [Hermetia illucens]
MKATGPTETSTPKAPFNKSIKRSRSKVTKSNRQSSTQQQQSSDLVYNPASAECFREKGHQRSYSGFGPKTIKVFWEQHDTSDTDVMPEAYAHLAEDATYKIWDVINTIKTYARHSGGRVTCNIVNEVLKDSDVPPILGSEDKPWDKIEYDGNFYFNKDVDIDLCKEYLREESPMEVLPSGDLTTVWSIDHQNSQILFEFSSTLCAAIFLGDDETFKYGLEIAAFAPHIGCIFKIILKKCIEMLAFEQTSKIIERCMQFLRALVFNIHSRDVECREQLFHLSELFACLICGPQEPEVKTESFELVKNFLESSATELKKDPEALNQIDVDDICNTYEALLQIMARNGFQGGESTDGMKIEPQDGLESALKVEPFEETVQMETNAIHGNQLNAMEEDCEPPTSEAPIAIIFSPYKVDATEDCIESVYSTLGELANNFGYFQSECTFVIVKRMERFFNDRMTLEQNDYKRLTRITRALLTLGEYAFREITPYLHKVDSSIAPEWIITTFNTGAIFLKGRDDIFLYEFLEDLCGDKMQPFMLYFYRYLECSTTKKFISLRKATYKIPSKVGLRCLERRLPRTENVAMYFPEAAPSIIKPKRIGFRFAGCRPVLLKAKPHMKMEKCFKQSPISKFQEKVVIARRKLLKPLINEKKYLRLSNFCFTQI